MKNQALNSIAGAASKFSDLGRAVVKRQTFGAALEAMKLGKRVAREGWNGKDMYLWVLPAAVVKREWVKDPMLLAVFGERTELNCQGSVRMKTANGEVMTGWVATQADMLAEDWVILD